MPQKLEGELKRVEHLEENIENSIKNIEKQNSFSLALVYAIILGVLSNIGSTIIYEIHFRNLSLATQTIIAVIVIVAIPVLIILLVNEFHRTKNQKQTLIAHLENLKEHKRRRI